MTKTYELSMQQSKPKAAIKKLLEELCIRALYKVRVQYVDFKGEVSSNILIGSRKYKNTYQFFIDNTMNSFACISTNGIIGRECEGQITPYLRSLWTMTKEEYNQAPFQRCSHSYIIDPYFKLTNIKTFTPQLLNWLYKKQFNINLPEELYLEMPEFMYNN